MKKVRNQYILLGLALVMMGALFAVVALLVIGYMPLVALGVAGIILGTVSFGLGRTLPRVSLETGLAILEAGLDNIAALIEELGLTSRALYLPTSLTNGVARALIPVHGNPVSPPVQRSLERRFIVRFGPGHEDFGVLVATPGSAVLPLQEISGASSVSELEVVLSALLVGTLDLVRAVRVPGGDETLTVELARPVLSTRHHPAYEVLGSPLASITATMAAEVLHRPVSVASEENRRDWHTIQLRLHEEVQL